MSITMRSRPSSFPAALGVALVCVGVGVAGSARAVGTDPTLVLTGVRATVSSTGAIAVSVDGAFNFDDLVQFPFPCGLIVWRGSSFVRYEFSGIVMAGSDPSVANGITAAEVPGLLGKGSPAAPPAGLLRLTSGRIEVALPAGVGSGTFFGLVYAVLEGDPFVSNPISFSVP